MGGAVFRRDQSQWGEIMRRHWLQWGWIAIIIAPMLVTVAGVRAQDATPEAAEATPAASPAGEPAASPVAESPGEPGPVFVSAQWRIALVAANRSPGINALSLERGAGRTWIVVVADITNWSPDPSTLDPRSMRLIFPEEEEPGGYATESSADVAAQLGTEPRQAGGPIEFGADETKRVTFAFQVSDDYTEPAFRYEDQALSLEDLLEVEIDFDSLPPVTPAPTLERVGIDDIIEGDELEVYRPELDENARVQLIGLGVPREGACFAEQSTDALAAMTRSSVLIERDPAAADDSDGTLRRYVWVQNDDGTRTLLNRTMIREGFAVWTGEPAAARFADYLSQAESAARQSSAGLWEDCGGLREPPTAPSASPTAAAVPPEDNAAETEEAGAASPAAELPPVEATATLEAAGQYPPSVAELAAADDPATCDRIGWGTPDEETLDGEQLDYYAACHEAGGVYLARCVGSAEGTGTLRPAEDRLWIVCVVVAANGGDEPLFASPVDYVLVDGNDRRYELNSTAMEAMPDDRVLQSGEIPPGERISGVIAFDVPRNATRPFRLEVIPLVEGDAGDAEPAVIIIDPNAVPPENG